MNAQLTKTTANTAQTKSTQKSRTDWERVDAMKDNEINMSDVPELDENFFANAEIRMPMRKDSITLRLDHDILEWYKSLGKGYQTRINAILRLYMNTKKG